MHRWAVRMNASSGDGPPPSPASHFSYTPSFSRFDLAVERVSGASTWAGILVLGALLAAIWVVIDSTGGTKSALPHLFYVPIIVAALPFGTRGSVATAVLAAILSGPLLLVDTVTGEKQTLSAMLVRGIMFVAVGSVASASMALRQKLYAERISRDLREAMIGRAAETEAVDLSLVPLVSGVLDRHAFHPVFQPVYSLRDGRLIAVEALTRFDVEPSRAPDIWFLAAHHVGRGTDLELAAIEAAIVAADELPDDVELWLNLSPVTIAHPRLRTLIDMCGGRKIALELSEHAIVTDYELLKERLARIRQPGVQIAVDDAGAGFSSLRHIVRLMPDITKLDISLTQNLASSPIRRALGEAMITFVHRMEGLLVVEGIDTAADLSAWSALGADAVQGFLTGRPGPLPAERLSASVLSLLGIPVYGPVSGGGAPLPRRRGRQGANDAAERP
jgi:EAL domain-containing protein (putative c-di-GMP-specific phosphodiesterase class I)